MPDSPSLNAEGPVEVEITSEGTKIPDSYEVMAVRTRAQTNRIPEAVIILADGDVATSDFPATDSTNFKPGAEIKIKAAFGAATTEEIFSGVVTAVRLRVNLGETRLEVTCRDKFFKTTMGRKSAIFLKKKDSDIISALASGAGLSATATTTTEEWPELVQSRVTDWDFILMRAEANGLVVNVADGQAEVKAPLESAAAPISVTYGEDLYELDVETDLRDQFATYKAEAWDPATQAVVSGEGTVTTTKSLGDLSSKDLSDATTADLTTLTSSAITASYLTTMMKARATRSEVGKLRGTVKFIGNAKVKPGVTLELDGVATRFKGKGYVSSVVHRIEGGAWMTEAGLGLAADWHSDQPDEIEMPGATGIAAPMRSLQIGKVTKLSEDPDGLHRIQVKLPMVAGSDSSDSVWARYSAPYASKAIGLMMLPEIDDEVVIGFLDDNPSYPIILGSLHNGTAARPQAVEDENNNIKVFLSREKLKLEFDEENKKITIETPGGNTMIFDDTEGSVTIKDQNGNSGVFDSSGITLDSASNIVIKAGGNIDIKATGNTTIEGVNVEAKGSAAFKGNGGGSAELSAGGSAKVSAPMVQIN